MVQRVGKEIFLCRHAALLNAALYGLAVYGIHNDGVVAAHCNGVSQFLVGIGLTGSHLYESRGDDNTLVALAHGKLLQYTKAHLGACRVRVVCVVKHCNAVCNLHRQTVLNGLQARNGVALLVRRYAQVVGNGNGCQYVQQVAYAQQAAAVVLAVAKGERYATGAVYNVVRLVVAFTFYCISNYLAWALYALVALYVFRVIVNYSKTTGCFKSSARMENTLCMFHSGCLFFEATSNHF